MSIRILLKSWQWASIEYNLICMGSLGNFQYLQSSREIYLFYSHVNWYERLIMFGKQGLVVQLGNFSLWT